MEILVLLISSVCAFGVHGNYHYVIAPNVIRLESQETFLVGILGDARSLQLTIWFEYLDIEMLNKSVWIYNPTTPVEVTFKVTANDLFKDVKDGLKIRNRPKTIKLVCQEPNGNKQSQDIPLSFKSGYLIVQTDKPLYNPDQTVLVRVLAMDENLKAIKNKYLEIDLINPSNMAISRRPFQPGSSTHGFYTCAFELPPFPEFGTWTVIAKLGDMLETYAISPIEVREFVLPTFGIQIQSTPEYILPSNNTVDVKITALYVYGKAVDGYARLHFNIRRQGDVSDPKKIFTMSDKVELNSNGQAHFSVDIKKLIANNGGNFPTGGVLELSANVYEAATGKEESEFDDSVMFVNAPYRFDFSRSKTTFRIGSTYYLQVYVFYVNGKKAANVPFYLEVYYANQCVKSTLLKTDSAGQSFDATDTFQKNGTYKLKVYAPGLRDYGEEIQLQPYTGDNRIIVEKIDIVGHPLIRAITNMQPISSYTGILFVVFARGKIITHAYRPAGMEQSVPLEDATIAKLAPVGRILAFYVHKTTGEVVADSSTFYLDTDQQVNKLELKPESLQVLPGASSKFTVFGPSGMWVGFNVIDKALLLLNNDNTLKHDKIFQEMEKHDLGCGAGSGTTSEEIFKNAGVTLLINSRRLDRYRIQRHSEGCADMKRSRRSLLETNECFFGADSLCCSEGIEYAKEIKIKYENDLETMDPDTDVSEPVPDTVCYARARYLAITYPDKLPHKCLMAYFTACLEYLSDALSENNLASGRSVFDHQDQYQKDISRLAGLERMLTVRRHFDTSFFFEEHMISGNNFTANLKFRDSITEWTIQAIGISEDYGPYIAASKDVKAFKDFFVQVDLPYTVTRKELFNVKVTVFNYVQTEQTARVYLKGVDKLCYGTSPGQHSPAQLLTLPPNSAKTLAFAMIPLEAGTYPITVSALVVNEHQPYVDIVEKQLYVVNEGIRERKTITVCLDPSNESQSCVSSPEVRQHTTLSGFRPSVMMSVDLTLPVTALGGSGSANAYISSNLMAKPIENVVKGVEYVIEEPSGCCQQILTKSVPLVTGMYYLKQTGTLTENHRQSGQRFMRQGLDRVSSCVQSDGSYQPIGLLPPGLWVTAFISKVVCRAEQAVPGIFGREKIRQMMRYLSKGNTGGTGHFHDARPISSPFSKDVDPSLTAYVLTALQECEERDQEVQTSIHRAMTALEGLSDSTLKSDPYLLAISTYALAVSNSSSKERFITLLRDLKRGNEGRIYWSKFGSIDSEAVETTAYALLAFLQFDDMKSSQKITAWLTEQSQGLGYWHTTKDSPVALQAIAAFSVRNYIPEVDLQTRLESGDGRWVKTSHLSNEHSVLHVLISDLPVPNGDRLKVTVTGAGTGILKIDLFYNRLAKNDEICPFEISPVQIKDVITEVAENPDWRLLNPEKPCDVCGYCPEANEVDVNVLQKREKRQVPEGRPPQKCIQFSVRSNSADSDAGMSIVEVNLETGVSVEESDLKKLQSNFTFIPLYEMPKDGKGFIVFYLTEVTSLPINFIFRLKDEFSGNETTRQGASIRVYDYYKPEKSCIKLYSISSNNANRTTCEGSDQCKCVQRDCSQPVDEELFRMALALAREQDEEKKRHLPKPVEKLMEYACNFEKANYVVNVTIEHVGIDAKRNLQFARSTVNNVLLQGGGNIQVDNEMDFEWQIYCTHPLLERGHYYYVIGKDISRLLDGEKQSVRYDLMGTALVINPRYKSLLAMVMNKFAGELKTNNGCTN